MSVGRSSGGTTTDPEGYPVTGDGTVLSFTSASAATNGIILRKRGNPTSYSFPRPVSDPSVSRDLHIVAGWFERGVLEAYENLHSRIMRKETQKEMQRESFLKRGTAIDKGPLSRLSQSMEFDMKAYRVYRKVVLEDGDSKAIELGCRRRFCNVGKMAE